MTVTSADHAAAVEALLDVHTARGAIHPTTRDAWGALAAAKFDIARAVLEAAPDGDRMTPVDPWFRITDGWPPLPEPTEDP